MNLAERIVLFELDIMQIEIDDTRQTALDVAIEEDILFRNLFVEIFGDEGEFFTFGGLQEIIKVVSQAKESAQVLESVFLDVTFDQQKLKRVLEQVGRNIFRAEMRRRHQAEKRNVRQNITHHFGAPHGLEVAFKLRHRERLIAFVFLDGKNIAPLIEIAFAQKRASVL